MSLFRWMLGLPLAALVTVGLFLMMTGLIRDDVTVSVPIDTPRLKVTRQIVDSKVNKTGSKDRETIDQKPPEVDTRIRTKSSKPTGVPTRVVRVPGGGVDGGPTITILKPIITFPPTYPEACRARGAEGEVLVQYDITDRGEVTNVRIISSDNSCFNRAVTKAMLQWKYPPQARRGLVKKFVFSLQDE